MSLTSLENEIVAGARVVFQNPKLRKKDLQEWATTKPAAVKGEVTAFISRLGVWVSVLSACDKRKV